MFRCEFVVSRVLSLGVLLVVSWWLCSCYVCGVFNSVGLLVSFTYVAC